MIRWLHQKLIWINTVFKRVLTPLKYHAFENIMENGAFALLEQMLNFHYYFRKYSKLEFLNFFSCFLKIENDVMI